MLNSISRDNESNLWIVSNIKSEMRSFKSNENIHKKEGGSYYVVSANKASSSLISSSRALSMIKVMHR